MSVTNDEIYKTFSVISGNIDSRIKPFLQIGIVYQRQFSMQNVENIDQYGTCLESIAEILRDRLRNLINDCKIRVDVHSVHVFHLNSRDETVLAAIKAANLRLAILNVDFKRLVIATRVLEMRDI